jgi:C-terminal processing protease CtpA/Prc
MRSRSARQAGARRLLIDVTGNGGGSEWVSEVIALMTPRTLARAEVRVVRPACDRRGAWQGKPACGAFGPEEPRATLQGTGEWSGPVFVLADRNTASASEDLVAWLQQNQIARVIGERTMGAGCGYIDGGTRTQLRASHFDVLMPNCARFLDDGTNEIEGIAPDIAIDMQSKDDAAKARALVAALERK